MFLLRPKHRPGDGHRDTGRHQGQGDRGTGGQSDKETDSVMIGTGWRYDGDVTRETFSKTQIN